MTYSVAITTFNRRFELFKNLCTKIKTQRPDIELIVLINGLTNLPFDEEYRKNVLEFVSTLKNTFPIVFPEFRSNTRFWNMACQMTTKDSVLILQDDVDIDDTFFDDFDREYVPYKDTCFKMNGYNCAFYLNKYVLDSLNWFDERYLGIGHEDGTFIFAYNAVYGELPDLKIPSLHNYYDLEWQKELLESEVRLDGQRLDDGERFSRFNGEIQLLINAGQDVYGFPPQRQYPYERFYWENKNKL